MAHQAMLGKGRRRGSNPDSRENASVYYLTALGYVLSLLYAQIPTPPSTAEPTNHNRTSTARTTNSRLFVPIMPPPIMPFIMFIR